MTDLLDGEPAVEAGSVAARAVQMMGADAAERWDYNEAIAWEGLLEVSRRLRRGAEIMLAERFDLTISMLGITGRLALAPNRTLRQTDLAAGMGLSLSRVSRVIDALQRRGLVERHGCPSDGRVSNITLTPGGDTLTSRAQHELFEHVHAAFADRLGSGELRVLATVFTRLLDRSAPSGSGVANAKTI